MKDVICFEVNDWHRYPKFFDEWFDFGGDRHEGKNWMKDMDAYAKENRLCVKVVCVDMAVSLVVTAPVEWVKKNIPEFEDERWQNYCVYKYPYPVHNDCTYLQIEGIEPVYDEKHRKMREEELYWFHLQFTEEDIENLKPHNIVGSPSGETFLDWKEENYGAWEYVDGKKYKEKGETGHTDP